MFQVNFRLNGLDSTWLLIKKALHSRFARYATLMFRSVAEESMRSSGTAIVQRMCLLETVPSLESDLSWPWCQSQRKVLKSELYFARFVAEHNLPFATANHFTRLVKVMFPDSKVADSFSCTRTKTAAFITHALAPSLEEAVISACQKQPFSILCDGGNDNFQKKCFGISEAMG